MPFLQWPAVETQLDLGLIAAPVMLNAAPVDLVGPPGRNHGHRISLEIPLSDQGPSQTPWGSQNVQMRFNWDDHVSTGGSAAAWLQGLCVLRVLKPERRWAPVWDSGDARGTCSGDRLEEDLLHSMI